MLPLCATAMRPLLQATENGCALQQHRVAGRRIARVADGQVAGQTVPALRGREDVRHMAHRLVRVDLAAVARGDARAFLAAMLQRVEAQIGQVRGFRMPVNGEDTALFVELVEHCGPSLLVMSEEFLERLLPEFVQLSRLRSLSGRSPRFAIRNSPDSLSARSRSASTSCCWRSLDNPLRRSPSKPGPATDLRGTARIPAADPLSRSTSAPTPFRTSTRPAPPPARHRPHRAPIPPGPRQLSRESRPAHASRSPCRAPAAVPTVCFSTCFGVLRAAESAASSTCAESPPSSITVAALLS